MERWDCSVIIKFYSFNRSVNIIQESRMRENLTYGLTRVQEKHVDDTLERDTRPKGEKQSGLTMSVQRCALVLLYDSYKRRHRSKR